MQFPKTAVNTKSTPTNASTAEHALKAALSEQYKVNFNGKRTILKNFLQFSHIRDKTQIKRPAELFILRTEINVAKTVPDVIIVLLNSRGLWWKTNISTI